MFVASWSSTIPYRVSTLKDSADLASRSGRCTLVTQCKNDQAHSGNGGDVLLAVDLIRHRAGHNLSTQVRLPKQRTRPRVDRMEVSFAATGEQQVGCRREQSAVCDIGHVELPFPVACLGI